MKRVLAFVLLTMFAATIGGCSKKTCETIADECDGSNDFEEACITDYKEGGECRDALKDLKDCVEDKGCDGSCNDEGEDVFDNCNEIADLYIYYY